MRSLGASKFLIYRKEGPVGLIEAARLATDFEEIAGLAGELEDLCAMIGGEEETTVVVLTDGGGNCFHIPVERPGRGEMVTEMNLPYLAAPIARLDQPVIAAIAGDAVGLGLELVLAGDLRMARESSRFSLPHIRAGLIPWDGGTQRLARLVGRAKALEMILTGRPIEAREAQRIGLINRVEPDPLQAGMELAREMALKAAIALRFGKEAVLKGMDLTLDQGLRLEADLYFLLHTTRDRTEGIEAFRQKRGARFEGE